MEKALSLLLLFSFCCPTLSYAQSPKERKCSTPLEKSATALSLADHVGYFKQAHKLPLAFNRIFNLEYATYFDVLFGAVQAKLDNKPLTQADLTTLWRVPALAPPERGFLGPLFRDGWLEYQQQGNSTVNVVATEKTVEKFGELAVSLDSSTTKLLMIWTTQRKSFDDAFKGEQDAYNLYSYSVMHPFLAYLMTSYPEEVLIDDLQRTFKIRGQLRGYLSQSLKTGRRSDPQPNVSQFYSRTGGSYYAPSPLAVDLWQDFLNRL